MHRRRSSDLNRRARCPRFATLGQCSAHDLQQRQRAGDHRTLEREVHDVTEKDITASPAPNAGDEAEPGRGLAASSPRNGAVQRERGEADDEHADGPGDRRPNRCSTAAHESAPATMIGRAQTTWPLSSSDLQGVRIEPDDHGPRQTRISAPKRLACWSALPDDESRSSRRRRSESRDILDARRRTGLPARGLALDHERFVGPSDAPYTAAASPAGPPPMMTVSYYACAGADGQIEPPGQLAQFGLIRMLPP